MTPLSSAGVNSVDVEQDCHSWYMTLSPVNNATISLQQYLRRGPDTLLAHWMLPFPEPAVCSLCVSGLCLCFPCSLMSSSPYFSLSSPLIRASWEHCDLLSEIFSEPFTLFSSPLLPPALFLWFLSLEPLCLVSHFQFWIPHKPLDMNFELWFLTCPLTLSKTGAYTHHLTHPLQTALGEDSQSPLWILSSEFSVLERLTDRCLIHTEKANQISKKMQPLRLELCWVLANITWCHLPYLQPRADTIPPVDQSPRAIILLLHVTQRLTRLCPSVSLLYWISFDSGLNLGQKVCWLLFSESSLKLYKFLWTWSYHKFLPQLIYATETQWGLLLSPPDFSQCLSMAQWKTTLRLTRPQWGNS